MRVAETTPAQPYDRAARDRLFAIIDERDAWERRITAAARAAYRAGYVDGRADERIAADRTWAAQPPVPLPAGPALADAEARRWHVCCRRCRLGGHRYGCEDCEDRTRETFGEPHRGDRPAGGRRAA